MEAKPTHADAVTAGVMEVKDDLTTGIEEYLGEEICERIERVLHQVALQNHAYRPAGLLAHGDVDVGMASRPIKPAEVETLAPLGAIFLALAMPGYAATLAGPGRLMLVVAVGLEVVAALWLRRLLRVPTVTSALASLLDAVVVGLESGMSFEQALGALVDRAPAIAHLPQARRLLADLELGQGTGRAFVGVAAGGPGEARIAALVTSSMRFGSPRADLLVIQAEALRDTDRRRAEAAARRLPVLMLFPLTFCVLPALLIVFLGPPLLSLVD